VRRLVPSHADWLFAALLVWLFASTSGWSALLADGDTGWHIRTGERILNTHRVPRTDPYSFTKAGAPWFAWEWGSDVVFAAAHRARGLGGVVLLSAALIAAYLVVLFRHLLWRGADFFVAVGLTLVAAGASTIHFLARPHVFSLALMAASLWILATGRRVWVLVPLSAVWANLHGGFAGLLASIGALAAGSLIGRQWRQAARYAVLGAACAAATVLNPYGIGLHGHLAAYLRSDWIRAAVDEFQSPKFRSESALDFELLLGLGILAVAWLIRRRRYGEAVLVAGWAHAALVSVRHVPVFAIAVLPAAAEMASEWSRRRSAGQGARSAAAVLAGMGKELAAGARRLSVWPALAVAALAVAPVDWPQDFPERTFPAALVGRHPELAGARVFTSDQWGDYLIYRFSGRTRVYIDGRSDFYGEELGNTYLRILNGQRGWQTALEEAGADWVLADQQWPLASALEGSGGWRLEEQAGAAALYRRLKKPPGSVEKGGEGGA
jgi:hypothetical protein